MNTIFLSALTAPEWVLIISAVCGSFGAMVVAIISAARGSVSARETRTKVDETHKAVNSRMDDFLAKMEASHAKLLTSAVAAAHAEGVKQATDTLSKVAQASPVKS